MDQLTQIMKVTGIPGPEFIQKLDSIEVQYIEVELEYLVNRAAKCYNRCKAE